MRIFVDMDVDVELPTVSFLMNRVFTLCLSFTPSRFFYPFPLSLFLLRLLSLPLRPLSLSLRLHFYLYGVFCLGKVAMSLALHFPFVLESLVVVDIAPKQVVF